MQLEMLQRIQQSINSFHEGEDGKITLVTGVVVLAAALLIGFVGNTGEVVNTKIELQNAADANAVSSATWAARGMNAVTLTNHLLGEATALCVIHEALGGPQVDAKLGDILSTESNALNRVIKPTLQQTAPIGITTGGVYGEKTFLPADQKTINFVVRQLTEDQGKHGAGAAIYDAKLTLKREIIKHLVAKSIANLGFLVPPPYGYVSAAAAYVVHAYSTSQIIQIGFEWVVLDLLEDLTKSQFMLRVKGGVEDQLIPALCEQASFVSGFDSQKSQFTPGPVNFAIERLQQTLDQQHDAQHAVFPLTRKFRLPVELEPGPSMRAGQAASGWQTDAPAAPDTDQLINDLNQSNADEKRQMQRRMNELDRRAAALDRQEDEVDDRLQDDTIDEQDRRDLEQEKIDIQASRARVQQQRTKVQGEYQAILQQEQEARQLINQLSSLPKKPGNPSLSHLPDSYLNQDEERVTQWVRATHPYVDAYRASVNSRLGAILKISEFKKHYVKWTNRFTLVKSWSYRSGYRFERLTNTTGSWRRVNKFEPLAMLVMEGAYQSRSSGSRKQLHKGQELWTRDTQRGHRQAEAHFTFVGFAHRPFPSPLFAKVVYKSPHENGLVCYAQSIFYNANPQEPRQGNGASQIQANVGWDTLNWAPPVRAPEWPHGQASSSPRYPWELFSGNLQAADTIRVKLNWQAKLMPVRHTRLRQAADEVSSPFAKAVEPAVESFDGLVTH